MEDMSRETYTSMIVGVAFFVGGMIAVVLLMKLLGQPAQAQVSYTVPQNISVSSSEENAVVTRPLSLISFDTRSLKITDTVTMLDERDDVLNYTSFDLTNNGPNPVFFSVNSKDWPEAPLPVGQSINVDFKSKGGIKKIYFRCNKGETANIYLYILK
jgi:hypothetical protein